MKRSMMDIFACPMDKHYPLELLELDVQGEEVKEAVIFCAKCSRYYPVIDEIPVMLPDDLREKQRDIDFLGRWQGRLPDKVLRQGNPWHL